MPLIYFSCISDDREEFFFADHDPVSSSINEGEANSSSSDLKSQYDKLPDCLKSCLDYLSFVTFKHSVDKDKLAMLLLAEGLVPQLPGIIMEEVADMIVHDLLCLGFLRETVLGIGLQVDHNYKQVCLLEVEKNDFVAKSGNSRVSALVYDDGKSIPPDFHGLQVHSLFVMTLERRSGKSKDIQGLSHAYMETICSLESLVVLDFNGIIECLPDEVGDMVHLRYLGLQFSGLNELSLTLANLWKLQTLDIRGCRLGIWHELPEQVLKIKQLRHLLMSHNINCEIKVPKGFEEMKNLYTCDGVYGGGGIANELGNLSELRKLGVKRVANDHSDELVEAIMKMRNLISLSLEAEGSNSGGALFPEMEQFSPQPLVRELYLVGGLVDIPNWVLSMENLAVLSLSVSRLLENQTWVLQCLPKLKQLTLWNPCDSKYMSKEFCDSGGFKELETLVISSLSLVEWREIVNGAFPSLRFLTFHNCVKLKFLPEGLQNISTLQQLYISPVYNDIGRRLYDEENYKIKHIKHVIIHER